MAVPRCQSAYLKQYRELLLNTVQLSKDAKICPGLECDGLLEIVQGNVAIIDVYLTDTIEI